MNTSTTTTTNTNTNTVLNTQIRLLDPTNSGVWVSSDTTYYEVVRGTVVFHLSTFNPITWEEDGRVYLTVGTIDERFPRSSSEDEVVMGDEYIHLVVHENGTYEIL